MINRHVYVHHEGKVLVLDTARQTKVRAFGSRDLNYIPTLHLHLHLARVSD